MGMQEIDFWKEFSQNAEPWANDMHSGRTREVFDAIDNLLVSCGFFFCFDITIEDAKCLFILSPEGDRDTAQVIDRLVSYSPKFSSWKILGRRQKKTLEDAAAIVQNLYLLNPLEMIFRFDQINHERFIEMIVHSSADLTPDEAQGMVNTFLWHALGEEFVMVHNIGGKVRFDDKPTSPTFTAKEMVDKLMSPLV